MMKYMKLAADWVSGQDNSVLVRAENGEMALISGFPEYASDGETFCICESMQAGMCRGFCWLPLNCPDGYKGRDLNGNECLVFASGRATFFNSLEEARRDALLDSPIATATPHFSSFMLTFMDEEELDSLPDDSLTRAFDVARSSDVSEGMLDSWSHFISPEASCEINELINDKPIFGGPCE